MRNIQTTQNATATLFANNVLEESFEADPLSDLQRILEQVQELNQKYNTKDEQKLYNNKFTTNSCSDSDSDIEHFNSHHHRHSLKTIDVSLNDSGELNLDNLRTEINNAENEYIKIRVPSDVDLRDIDLRVEDSDCENKNNVNNNNNNSEQKKRTRNREKTIAEYFV